MCRAAFSCAEKSKMLFQVRLRIAAITSTSPKKTLTCFAEKLKTRPQYLKVGHAVFCLALVLAKWRTCTRFKVQVLLSYEQRKLEWSKSGVWIVLGIGRPLITRILYFISVWSLCDVFVVSRTKKILDARRFLYSPRRSYARKRDYLIDLEWRLENFVPIAR